MLDISIVILSWNDKERLDECLRSIQNSTKSRSVEIIVVDNGSTDGSPEMIETAFPAVRVIRNGENLGFPKGNNIGILESKGKYIVLLNSDIKVLPGCLDALCDYLDEHSTIGIIGPRVLNADLTHQS